ncbi:MAG TPA: SDR family NAD(P)-dependent oxidoreductase [Candidatus Acidoferrales bacterium]|nr:SDR family NAD(P)-dependent oxidoreductase [Candidatus Acidoferrales bacterium]
MSANRQPLAGQVALVTGSSRGIGWAVARRLGVLGARVSLCARSAGPLELARRRLAEQGVTALATRADVTHPAQIGRLVRATRRALGEIDILVNNAGVGWFGPLAEATEREWDRILNTNLKGPFLMIRAVAPAMIRRRSGNIVNIASLAGKNAFAGGGVYCASKWGLLGMSYSAAEDLRGYGIRVSVVCPGTVMTEFSPHSGKNPRKMLQPDDVAVAVEAIVLQPPRSFISEVLLRPTEKP